ncbi:hypothetical protein KTGMC3_P1726 [Methanocalculus sp. MC3]
MPWMGFFYKMEKADEYILLDHVQFKKRYFENRNCVVSPRGDIEYITVPVIGKDKSPQPINAVEIDNSKMWKKKLLNKIRHYYSKAPFFQENFCELESLIIDNEYNTLLSFNMMAINFFRKKLDICTPMKYSSDMDIHAYKGTDLILQICLKNNADVYLCGQSGYDYLDQEQFNDHGIEIEWLDYKCPYYPQLCDQFIRNLSTVDLLLNKGSESLQIIMAHQSITSEINGEVEL